MNKYYYNKQLIIREIIAIFLCLLICCGLQSSKAQIQTGIKSNKVNIVEKNSKKDPSSFHFQSGDILFQDLDCGDLCDAIEKVTHGIDGKSFSHIGLIYVRNDSTFVIEAIGANVHLTPLNSFLNRNKDEKGNPKIVVGRLKATFRKLNVLALQFALAQIGTPYDDAFIYNNQKYYCSELIYDAYKYANNNQPFFQLTPMTFKDPSTGKIFPAWEKYYQDLHLPIPEGEPGCNPAGISRSKKIDIVATFY